MNEKHIQRIQGQDECNGTCKKSFKQLEDIETAEKEKAIRKQDFDDNFELIKSGKSRKFCVRSGKTK